MPRLKDIRKKKRVQLAKARDRKAEIALQLQLSLREEVTEVMDMIIENIILEKEEKVEIIELIEYEIELESTEHSDDSLFYDLTNQEDNYQAKNLLNFIEWNSGASTRVVLRGESQRNQRRKRKAQFDRLLSHCLRRTRMKVRKM